MYAFPNSTAISEISEITENQVAITWTSGSKTYQYELSNPRQFSMDLKSIVKNKGSIGRFINSQIQKNYMRQV
jgi:hypothetical protein